MLGGSRSGHWSHPIAPKWFYPRADASRTLSPHRLRRSRHEERDMNRSKGFRQLLGALLALCVAPLCAAQSASRRRSTLGLQFGNAGSRPGARPSSTRSDHDRRHLRRRQEPLVRKPDHPSHRAHQRGRQARARAAFECIRLPAAAHRRRQVALRRAGASIYPGTNRRLTFSGQTSIVVPPAPSR